MRQRWRSLLFLHFPCDPAEVQPHLPPGLEPDLFPDEHGTERAWIGLVPFRMTDVRLSGLPPFPGTHTFPETNVRTYVHRAGRDPGVWFFSLDAANALAVAIARLAFSLPYYKATMSVRRTESAAEYASRREGADCLIEATLGDALPTPRPGSLEFFLVERYLLYAARGPRLLAGRVHHSPYALRSVSPLREEETLVRAAGLTPRPFTHRLFAEGVDVEIFPLRKLQ